MVVSEYK